MDTNSNFPPSIEYDYIKDKKTLEITCKEFSRKYSLTAINTTITNYRIGHKNRKISESKSGSINFRDRSSRLLAKVDFKPNEIHGVIAGIEKIIFSTLNPNLDYLASSFEEIYRKNGGDARKVNLSILKEELPFQTPY